MKLKKISKSNDRKIKKGKILIGVILGLMIGVIVLKMYKKQELILITNTLDVELGQRVSTNIDDYLDNDKISTQRVKKMIKNTKEKDNLKYVKIINKDEKGNVVSQEEKDYPQVGNYEIHFTYGKEKATVKVVVKDTTKPEIKAPESMDIIQYTDLSVFNFGELLEVTDYSKVKDWKIDISKVDVNTIGNYDLRVSIQDQYKNKASKKLKVNIVKAPVVEEGEVAITEIVTDELGNKKTVVTKKAKSEVSNNDAMDSSSAVINKGTVKSKATNTKPMINSGVSKPSTGSNVHSSSQTSEHKHNYTIPITKTVHHEALTKVVHHDSVTKDETITIVDKEAYDEPVYETHIVCKVCEKDFGKYGGASADDHSCDTGHSYHSIKVKIKTIHHDALTHQETKSIVVTPGYDETVVVKEAYDETVTTGYKCFCGAIK